MQLQTFPAIFRKAVGQAAPHVSKERGRALSGCEMANIVNAALKAGIERPTPEVVTAIAQCVRVGPRQRRRIIHGQKILFFGLKSPQKGA